MRSGLQGTVVRRAFRAAEAGCETLRTTSSTSSLLAIAASEGIDAMLHVVARSCL